MKASYLIYRMYFLEKYERLKKQVEIPCIIKNVTCKKSGNGKAYKIPVTMYSVLVKAGRNRKSNLYENFMAFLLRNI
ncbi:hypothetical protein EX87_18825 (plasmid) [Brevibacillus laterosporus]|uniref:Uncharacterized protein n=1 Tax=Brevibacillus laterosporus TaxID=1465 RepID=A0A0F7C1A3_BRELA|nr:hypothetical protein EX87_18825 [Brevibacillus laterosporus]